MLNFKVSKVRYQYGDNPTNTKFVEVDIKTKLAESIIELIKCIL